ncbi:MAG: ABC transporter ATP-binding protein [Clostridiales bacterium]|nr:ABC transporter ATP-binding protein [Clostridiales bacterium]
MIAVKGLRASYAGEEILHGIDASFPDGKISVIIGPNGCGKSTTIRSILRLVPDIKGDILLDGSNMRDLTRQEISRRVAYLPQSRSVPDITVGRLVLHGRFPYLSYPRHYRREDHEKAAQALEWVGLSDYSERKLENLSGGQRQKAYLAMALAQDTDVIMMDEPTTFLDIKNQLDLLDRSRILAVNGKTVIMILHDFEAVLHYADHVVLMCEGRVMTSGNAEDVLRSKELTEAFGVTPGFYETEDGLHCYVKGGM